MDSAQSIPSRPRSAVRHHQENRRHSANLESSSKPTRRPLSRGYGPPPASSEVISSLISSLSAISTPAENLYDNLIPNGTTPKSAPSTASKPFLSHNVRDETISEDPRPETFVNPDDAAIPPIVRTSKHPSGLSPLTAPKNKSPTQAPVLFTTSSIHDAERIRSSIGSISVEPRHMPSYTSLQTVSTHRSKSNKSLKVKASKEKMRELDRERRRKPEKHTAPEDGDKPSLTGKDESRALTNSENLTPTLAAAGGLEIPTRIASWHPSPSKDSPDPPLAPQGSPSSPSKRVVPARDSSLRHSLGPSAKRKSKAYRIKPVEDPDEAYDGSADNEAPPSKDKGKQRLLDEDEESVARRIQELKAQKELRRISQQTLAEQERLQEAERKEKSLQLSNSASGNVMVARSASAAAAPGKENVRPEGEADVQKTRDPLLRAVTEPIPLDHTKTFDRIAPGRVSTSTSRALPSLADSIDEAIDAYLADPRLSRRVQDQRTGRTIAFSEVGDPGGSVVFCCVGMGTTRYLMAFYDELATTLKLRLITPDRPGIGESEPHEDGADTPLGWPDDIRTICTNLRITRFSVLAHSAGAVYALATALRIPEHIRGRIHLMAPWIPPSQMVAVGIQKDQVPNTSLPYSQRLLRSLPTPFLRVANSGFFAMTSNSLASAMPKNSPKRKQRRSLNDLENPPVPTKTKDRRHKRNSLPISPPPEAPSSLNRHHSNADTESAITSPPNSAASRERESEYEFRLTHAIWEAATTNANPAVDLLVCLERRQDIGFRYADVGKELVIHHGAKDTRVPVENVEWLSNRMRRCELRILEEEGHGLMASAKVMGDVLSEVAKEWEDWNTIVNSRRTHRGP